MANDNVVRMRFRPVGTAQRRQGVPEYSPLGTGCPAVEQAVAALYQAQNEESFWALMNALNYAMELDTEVLVPLARFYAVSVDYLLGETDEPRRYPASG